MNQTCRLAKAISNGGYCSRRDAEKLIAQGAVYVNEVQMLTPAINVSMQDVITIKAAGKSQVIKQLERVRLWLYHKPVGLITTHRDPQGRPTIFANLPNYMPRVISVGRLDMNSEGLLLLTNSGEFARMLEMPKNKYHRTYKVRVFGNCNVKALQDTKNGLCIDGINYKPISVNPIKISKNNSWFEVVLDEGKNREIRKIFEYFNLSVNRLIRVSYGQWELGALRSNEVMEVDASL